MPLSWVSVVIARDTKSIVLSLFGGFVLTVDGARVALPMHARRVLAYLSLQPMSNNGCNRQLLAQRLWIDSPSDRSRASLRTAMWKIRVIDRHLLVGDSEQVALAGFVHVDVHEFGGAPRACWRPSPATRSVTSHCYERRLTFYRDGRTTGCSFRVSSYASFAYTHWSARPNEYVEWDAIPRRST